MGALLGYVVDIIVAAFMEMTEIDNQMKSRVIRAFNKVVWIQNDLFARHYIHEVGEGEKTGVDGVNGTNGESGGCPFSGKTRIV